MKRMQQQAHGLAHICDPLWKPLARRSRRRVKGRGRLRAPRPTPAPNENAGQLAVCHPTRAEIPDVDFLRGRGVGAP